MQKCIIFDCDGVLVDSEIITTRHFIKHIHELGYEISVEEAIKDFTGKTAKAVYQHIGQASGLHFSTELMQEIETNVHHALHAEVAAIPGIAEVLEKLQGQTKLQSCLASSGSYEKINKSLRATGLSHFFHEKTIFSAQSVSRGKPAPDLFLYAAEQMKTKAAECLVIEDSEAGIEAALSAKMSVIGFLGGSHAHYEWYQEKIKAYKVPLAHNSHELATLLAALR